MRSSFFKNMKYNILHDKTLNFAANIVELHKYLVRTQKEYDLPRQILRSGTSIGANCMESRSAQSTADFISKLSIALKEADETSYWLRLFLKINYISDERFKSLDSELQEIIKILVTIIKKSKESLNSHLEKIS